MDVIDLRSALSNAGAQKSWRVGASGKNGSSTPPSIEEMQTERKVEVKADMMNSRNHSVGNILSAYRLMLAVRVVVVSSRARLRELGVGTDKADR